MDKEAIIELTKEHVKQTLQDAEGGHDWWHTLRVYTTSKYIAKMEGGDLFIIEMSALLHDIADSKFNDGDEEIGPEHAYAFMRSIHVEDDKATRIKDIIKGISYKGGHNKIQERTIELDIVSDADKLDALGAVGIARAFNYGGHKGRALYDPDIPPNPGMSKEEYKKANGPTINHFYEKLFLLKDLMHTNTAKLLAEERHLFMVNYVNRFIEECEQSYEIS